MRTNENKVKNQHYVPQGLLRKFASHKGLLCQYIKPEFPSISGKIAPEQKVENCCVVANDYFYDCEFYVVEPFVRQYIEEKYWEQIKENVQPVDEMLSRMEDSIFPMIHKLYKRRNLIFERAYLQKIFLFSHTLAYRNIALRSQLESIYITDQKNYPQFYYSRFGDKEPALAAREEHIKLLLDNDILLNDINTYFTGYDIYLAENYTNEKFIISDDPALDLRMGAANICIPLYPDLAIVLQKKQDDTQNSKQKIAISQLNASEVIKYNILQLKNGKCVFGEEQKLQCYKLLFEQQFNKKHITQDIQTNLESK